jgi:hypothetical protein
MEIDIKALDMLPADEENSLFPCVITCFISCKNDSCWITV